MQNPQITTKLNLMMRREQQEKHDSITCILDAYKQIGTINNSDQEFNCICELQALHLGDLSQILGDLISDLASKLFFRV